MRYKTHAIGALAATVGLFFTTVAGAASPRPHRPDVVGPAPIGYALNAEWITGVSQDGGAKGQSLEMTDFAYYAFANWWDQTLANVTKVRASFLAGDTTVNLGGSPRFSLDLDVDANGAFDLEDGTVDLGDVDVIIYLDPASCGDTVAGGWVEANFTGDKTNCTITDSTGASYVSDADGTAWSKVVAAYPDAKVWFLFLIQDATTGINYVDRIMLDSAFFTKQP